MTNIYFPDEEISTDDLMFICYMIERISRKIKQPNSYVVNKIGESELRHLISVANVLHCENPLAVEERWISDYNLECGKHDVSNVDSDLVDEIPTPLQMGKVYQRLICDTILPDEDFVQGIIRVYNDEICGILDNYNASAYYEPSYIIARAYKNGGF